ncbi:MAG: SAM-dependent chlorinase/fluorinase [bacterium]
MKSSIVLLTDFGLSDSYVGQMKGVIASLNPNANVIDLTHDIQPQNIKHGAFILVSSCTYFPKGTIFVCVIDPGVGSKRKAIAVQTENYYFIAPDNGLLTFALEKQEILQVIELDNQEYHFADKSNTFHGRDVFAPVAAHLSLGIETEKLGSEIDINDIIKLKPLKLKKKKKKIVGEIIYADKFGNLITSIHKSDIQEIEEDIVIQFGKEKIRDISKTYSDVKKGKLLAYIGSSGYLEIGVRGGNAEK